MLLKSWPENSSIVQSETLADEEWPARSQEAPGSRLTRVLAGMLAIGIELAQYLLAKSQLPCSTKGCHYISRKKYIRKRDYHTLACKFAFSDSFSLLIACNLRASGSF